MKLRGLWNNGLNRGIKHDFGNFEENKVFKIEKSRLYNNAVNGNIP
ncbi:hypothetical protein CLOSBL3_10987 [Clostridiaceae bacterium BL-3]|nr:hypothetical protein CLOSBL3_10987 [Clostridiaceae bacterium BL-3]